MVLDTGLDRRGQEVGRGGTEELEPRPLGALGRVRDVHRHFGAPQRLVETVPGEHIGTVAAGEGHDLHTVVPQPHHSGPAFGYVIEGAVRFELEGEPERVVKAGETFWEPGGDVIHYQDGNALTDEPCRFVVTMLCAPGQPMLTFIDEEELAARAHLRAPHPVA